MNKILQKLYPLCIGTIIGFPIWTITYLAMEDKWHCVFWFMMFIYIMFIVIQQIKWLRK
jgi:hypothetical protein